SPDTTHLPHPRSNALRQARSTRRTQQHGSSILPPGCSGDLVGRAPTCLLLLGGGALVDRLVLECHQDRGLWLDQPSILLDGLQVAVGDLTHCARPPAASGGCTRDRRS